MVCVLCLIFETPWTVGCQAPLFMAFPRQGFWSGVPFPPPGVLFNPGIELVSPELSALAGASPRGTSGKEPACQCRRARQFTPVFLPGESNRQRSLVGIVHRVTQSRTRLKGLAPFSHTKTSCLLQRKEGYCSND